MKQVKEIAMIKFATSERKCRLLVQFPCCDSYKELSGSRLREIRIQERRGIEVHCREHTYSRKPVMPRKRDELHPSGWTKTEIQAARDLAFFTKFMFKVSNDQSDQSQS